jgi:hypothetical protein
VRNPGRRDGDDARVGSIDPTVPQTGSDGGPADDDPVGVRAPDASRSTEPHSADHAWPAGNDDVGDDLDGDLFDDLDVDLDVGPADRDDALLFDPLLSDEPIDLAAVRADDALIDALSGGDLAGADDLADDDPLIAMLAAWAASARPEPTAVTHPTEPDVAATGSSPHVPTRTTGSPAGEVSDDGAPDAGSAEPDDTDDVTERRPDLDPPTVRLIGPRRPAAEHRPATPGTVRPSLAARRPADALGEPGDGPGGAPHRAATAAASVVTLLSRVRTAGRRTRPPGQALPPGHPLRRAAVALVVAALAVSGAAASGGTAQPGDPAWAITKVLFADRAESIMAAQVVSAGLERAQFLLSQGQPELAKQQLAAISASLQVVSEEDGHKQLSHQQQMLEAVAALTPPIPGDPNLTATTTPGRKADPDTSVLAQGAPRTAGTNKAAPPAAAPPAAAPPVVVKSADPATGSTGATTNSATGTDTGTTGSSTTGTGTGTTGSSTTGTGTTGSQTGTGSTAVGPTGTGPVGNDTALAQSAPGPAANDTAPAGTANDTTLAEADTGGQPAVPAPAPSLDAARSAGTSGTTTDGTTTDGTTTSESLPSTTTDAGTGSAPATPPTADEPAPVTVLSAQKPADGPATVDNQADGNGNPSASAADTPKALAEGSAPAVPADAAGPAETGDAVVPEKVRTTGVVPEPMNVATPPTATETTTTKASDKPALDTPADEPTRTTSTGDTPEPVHVTTDDNRGPGSHPGSGSDSNSDSNSGSGGGSDSGASNNDNGGSGSSGSDGASDDNGSDIDDPGGARASAAVSIHP